MKDLTSTYLDNSTSSNLLDNNITESSTNTEYIISKYWNEVLHEDKLIHQCKNCKKLQFSINTSKSYLKKHTAKYTTQNIKFNFIKPITKEDVDNSIIDLVVGSWISDNWNIINILLSFQKSGQTVKDIKSVIINTLNNYNIKDKFFSIIMDNTTTNKAVVWLLQKELPNIDLISIRFHKIMKYLANPLANGHIELIESYYMFKRYIILHLAIKEMQLKETSMPSCLEIDKLLELELTCKILKSFAIATTILSKDHKISDYVLITHILDPRYKMEHLKATLLEIGGYSEKYEDYIKHDKFFPKSIQPSSVASEQAFSHAGFTVTKDKANLNENTVSSTILMHSWLKESQKKSSPLENLSETK
ncbi:23109_t:CDS:2 [Cetraspora pellucida]|uniref:23109_t:CDS:1 n=1 Tax=Cetraspora pellucida TaxID=1433469 RepID=A0A9N8YUI8_9GLOM|nr:23109_t:CDS:2 [Cetraspora pellucida]